MYEEILEQPGIVARLTADRELFGEAAAEARAAGVRFVLYAARGTSDNAAVYGKYLATILAGMPAGLAVPSAATIYDAPMDLQDCLVIGISQSGETPDVVEYVTRARESGAHTVAITNDETSLLARAAGRTLATGAGRERAIAATKTYTSQLAALAMFWAAWTTDGGLMDALHGEIPDAMRASLGTERAVGEAAARLSHADRLIVVGRGYNYATALEVALKLKETCYLAATPFSAADLMHGPIAIVESRYPALLFATPGRTHRDLMSLATDLQARGAETYVVGGGAVPAGAIALPVSLDVPEALSPLVAVIPGQLLAERLSLVRGFDPDRPRGLSKITHTL